MEIVNFEPLDTLPIIKSSNLHSFMQKEDAIIKVNYISATSHEECKNIYSREKTKILSISNFKSELFPKIYNLSDLSVVKQINSTFKCSYYLTMDKMTPLTEDEYKVFHSLSLSKKNVYTKIIFDLSRFLTFDRSQVIRFTKRLQVSTISNTFVLSADDIMKDDLGEFKIVNFETIEKLNLNKNNNRSF